MTKVFNNFMKLYFWPIFSKKKKKNYLKIQLSYTASYEFLKAYLKLEKSNIPISDRRTNRRTEGRTHSILQDPSDQHHKSKKGLKIFVEGKKLGELRSKKGAKDEGPRKTNILFNLLLAFMTGYLFKNKFYNALSKYNFKQ